MQSFDNIREECTGVSNWQKAISAITLFVEDKNRAKDFYAKAFDLTPLHEDESGVTLRLENVYLRLSVISEAQHSDALQIAPAAVGGPITARGRYLPSSSTTSMGCAENSATAGLFCSTGRRIAAGECEPQVFKIRTGTSGPSQLTSTRRCRD